MKLCPKCEVDKPDTAFHKDKTKKSGLSSYCKTCDKSRNRTEQIREYRRRPETRALNRERMVGYRAKYPERFQVYRETRQPLDTEYQRKIRAADPSHIHARKAVYWRAHTGQMPHPTTLQCGTYVTLGELPRRDSDCACQNTANHYHHYAGYDGDNRFQVQALCYTCHGITQRH